MKALATIGFIVLVFFLWPILMPAMILMRYWGSDLPAAGKVVLTIFCAVSFAIELYAAWLLFGGHLWNATAQWVQSPWWATGAVALYLLLTFVAFVIAVLVALVDNEGYEEDQAWA